MDSQVHEDLMAIQKQIGELEVGVEAKIGDLRSDLSKLQGSLSTLKWLVAVVSPFVFALMTEMIFPWLLRLGR